jgi:hypothetical protein
VTWSGETLVAAPQRIRNRHASFCCVQQRLVKTPPDLGVARANRLTDVRCRRPWAKRGPEGRRSLRKNFGDVVPPGTVRAAGRVSMGDPFVEESGLRTRSGRCRMRPINGIKSEMSVSRGAPTLGSGG